MTKKQKELMERAIGVIEGIALVATKDVREALYVAIEMLDEVSDGNAPPKPTECGAPEKLYGSDIY